MTARMQTPEKPDAPSPAPLTAGLVAALGLSVVSLMLSAPPFVYAVARGQSVQALDLLPLALLVGLAVSCAVALGERPRVRFVVALVGLAGLLLVPVVHALKNPSVLGPTRFAAIAAMMALAASPAGIALARPANASSGRGHRSADLIVTLAFVALVLLALADRNRAAAGLPLDLLTLLPIATAGAALLGAIAALQARWPHVLTVIAAAAFVLNMACRTVDGLLALSAVLIWTLAAGLPVWRHARHVRHAGSPHPPPFSHDRALHRLRLIAGCASGLVLLATAGRLLPDMQDASWAGLFAGRPDMDDLQTLISMLGALAALAVALRALPLRTVALTLIVPAFGLWLPPVIVAADAGATGTQTLLMLLLGAVGLFTCGAALAWLLQPDGRTVGRLTVLGGLIGIAVFAALALDAGTRGITGLPALPTVLLFAAAFVSITAATPLASDRLRIAVAVLFGSSLAAMVIVDGLARSPFPGVSRPVWGSSSGDGAFIGIAWLAGMALLVVVGAAALVLHVDAKRREDEPQPFTAVAELEAVPDLDQIHDAPPADPAGEDSRDGLAP